MNCRETERLLDTFFDGELDGRLMRDAALHITRCPSCETELRGRERLHDVLCQTIERDVDGFDLGAIWSGVQQGIARAESGVEEAGGVTASRRRRLGGFRAGGRFADQPSREAQPRRAIRRVSAFAGFGAVAVGLAAVLLFPGEQEYEPREVRPMSRTSSNVGRDASPTLAAPVAAPAVRVAGPQGETPSSGTNRLVSVPAPGSAARMVVAAQPVESPVAPAPLGPVEPEEPLSSQWAQQVQVGPLEYSDHAMSLWPGTLVSTERR